MVDLISLWLPILLSAVAVFFVSSVVHMVLPYHRGDYRKLPEEDKVREALRAADVPPGDYMFPHAGSSKELSSPEMVEKFKQGPVGLMTMMRSGPPAMGRNLVLWFLFCLVMSIFVAYLARVTLPAGTGYLTVFRVVGTAGFLGYSMAQAIETIWKQRCWGTTLKHMFDGLIYSLVTGGIFGWLWP